MPNVRSSGWAAVLLVAGAVTGVSGQCLPQFRSGTESGAVSWQGYPGANGLVQAMTVADPDGPSGPVPLSLIVAGQFSSIGTVRSRGLAYWNPSTGWVRMGSLSTTADNFYSLSLWNGRIIAAGGFSNPNPSEGPGSVGAGNQPQYVAAWDPTAGQGGTGAWVKMSAAAFPGGTADAAVDFGGTLYVLSRSFNNSSLRMLSRYVPGATITSGTWSPVSIDANGEGSGLCVHNGELYVTGSFSRTGSTTRFQVAKLNAAGTEVEFLPQLSTAAAANGAVSFDGSLVAFGGFVGGVGSPIPVGASKVARFDGAAWQPVTTGANAASHFTSVSSVRSAAVVAGELIVGTDSTLRPIASLSGPTALWESPALLPGGPSGGSTVEAICQLPNDSRIALGGNGSFAPYADTSATRLVFWAKSTNTWTAPANGFADNGFGYPFIDCAASLNGSLYMGGLFNGVGQTRGTNLARWDGAVLAAVPGAPSLPPTWMLGGTGPGARLFLGGSALRVTAFDGTSFLPITDAGLPQGIASTTCGTLLGGDLVVGGSFSLPGGQANLARRSGGNGPGGSWGPLGGVSPNAQVTAMTAFSTPAIAGGAELLVITGSFTSVGPLSARVAAWDGSTWRALGQASIVGSSSSPAVSLLTHDGALHMAVYTNGITGSNTYPVVLRYNPVSDAWTELPRPVAPVASGFGVPVRAVSAAGSLWLASTYTVPGASDTVAVLRWNGSVWSSTGGIGGGFGQSRDLTVHNGEVILTGLFAAAGTQPVPGSMQGSAGVFSNGWARLSTGGTLPSVGSQPIPAAVCIGGGTSFSVSGIGQPPLGYRWQVVDAGGAATDLSDGAVPGIATTITGAGTPTLQLTGVFATADRLRFRCIVSNDCGGVASEPGRLFVDPADTASQGGAPGRDGVRDNNDFIVFIDYFFSGDARADIGRQGGVLGDDGTFDNNDFIVFIDRFFAGC